MDSNLNSDSVAFYPICFDGSIRAWLKFQKRKLIFFSPFFFSRSSSMFSFLLIFVFSEFCFYLFELGLFVIFLYVHTHTLHLYAATKTISISFKLIDIYVNKNDSWLFVHVVIWFCVYIFFSLLFLSLFLLPYYSIAFALLFSIIRFVPFSLPKRNFFFRSFSHFFSLTLNWYFNATNSHISYSNLVRSFAFALIQHHSVIIFRSAETISTPKHTSNFVVFFPFISLNMKQKLLMMMMMMTKKKSQSLNDARRK